jgi:hypothetical protein
VPSSAAILQQLTEIANEWQGVAFAWHVYLGVLLLAAMFGWRPSVRRAGYLLVGPLISVAVAAWTFGNLFNGTLFLLMAILLSATARRLPVARVHIRFALTTAAGLLLIAFGSVYPHFLIAKSWTAYTYAAPVGLIPCPTLSVVIGMTLLLGMHSYRTWSAIVAVTGVVYGVIGVFAFGVLIDYVLLAGASGLLVATTLSSRRTRRTGRTDARVGAIHAAAVAGDFVARKSDGCRAMLDGRLHGSRGI